MTTETINQNRTLATLIHLSVFSEFFFPMGNFIFPLILWLVKREDPFVDAHGRNALNFQISLFLYMILLICLGIAGVIFMGAHLGMEEPFIFSSNHIHSSDFPQALPFFVLIGSFGVLCLGLCILQIFGVISASLKASEGKLYKYPLTINFISPANPEIHQSNQSENEQFNNTQNQRL